MKNTRKTILIMITAMILLLVGCRPSDEKLAEAEEARNLLLQVKQTAEDTYLDISDTSLRSSLDELAGKEAEIEQIDFTTLSDKKIDEILPTITELTNSYQNLGKDHGTEKGSSESGADYPYVGRDRHRWGWFPLCLWCFPSGGGRKDWSGLPE